MAEFYHEGMRQLQAQEGAERLATILEKGARHDSLTQAEAQRIREAEFFFIASCFAEIPEVSFKAGPKGFVSVLAPHLIEFPDYDGNYMFRTLGNILKNPNVQMLFVTFDGKSNRLRIGGEATVIKDEASLSVHLGAKALVRVRCKGVFPNCPRYIPNLRKDRSSRDLPQRGKAQPVPDWKRFPFIAPALPDNDQHRAEALASPLMPPG